MSGTNIGQFAQLLQSRALSHERVVEEIRDEFEIADDRQLISGEKLALLISELASERICSRLALATLNTHPDDDPDLVRQKLYEMSAHRFELLIKISAATREANTLRARENAPPEYFQLALYIAHIRLFERDGRAPGWRKLAQRVKQILGRSPHSRQDWECFITKSRIEKMLPLYREATQKPDYPSAEFIAWATESSWLI